MLTLQQFKCLGEFRHGIRGVALAWGGPSFHMLLLAIIVPGILGCRGQLDRTASRSPVPGQTSVKSLAAIPPAQPATNPGSTLLRGNNGQHQYLAAPHAPTDSNLMPASATQPVASTTKTPGMLPANFTAPTKTPVESSNLTNVSDASSNLSTIRRIVDQATVFAKNHPQYTVRVRRRERVNNKLQDEEVMLMNFRLQPRSIFYRWLDKSNEGREAVWVEGQNDGKLITRGGKGDFLLAGRQLRLDPQGALARARSRYTIDEAGLDKMTAFIEDIVQRLERGDTSNGTLTYMGEVERPELNKRLLEIKHMIPPKVHPAFPKGGIRYWYFDPQTHRLCMVRADSYEGQFIEHFIFDRFITNPTLDQSDFDPDDLWKKRGRSKKT